MAQRIRLRRGSAAAWTTADTVLGIGEPGVESDTGRFKIGDGATEWTALDYAAAEDTGTASEMVAYTSGTCTSGASLAMASVTLGTDQTTPLQALLNDGGATTALSLTVDGRYSATQLAIKGNTELLGLGGCGFIQRNTQNKPLLINANPSDGSITDENISISGLILHGNMHNQGFWWGAGGYTEPWPNKLTYSPLVLLGVNNLTVRDVTVRSASTFAVFLANVFGVTIDGLDIDVDVTDPQISQDGIHICGPSARGVARNLRLCTYDDAIAFNCDDVYAFLPDEVFGTHVSYGDITDWLVDGAVFRDALQGVRLFSTVSRLDRIVIKNLSGTVLNSIAHIMDAMTGSHLGNVGTVEFDGVDVLAHNPITPVPFGDTTAAGFIVDDSGEHLILRRCRKNKWSDDRTYFQFEAHTDWEVVEIIDFAAFEDDEETDVPILTLASGGHIGTLIIRGATRTQTYGGTAAFVNNLGTIDYCYGSGYVGTGDFWSGNDATATAGDAFGDTGGPTAPTYLIDEGFEGTGAPSGWTSAGTPDWDYSAAALVGSQSLRLAVASSSAYKTFSAGATRYAYFQFRLTTLTGSAIMLGLADTGVTDFTAALKITSAGVATLVTFGTGGGGESSASATTIVTGTTYHVWLKALDSGTCELAVSTTGTKPTVDGSGAVVLTVTGGTADTGSIFFQNNSCVVIVDHVLVDDAVIGNSP